MKLIPQLRTGALFFKLLSTGIWFGLAVQLSAANLNLSAAADTTLDELDPDNNLGANSFLEAGVTAPTGGNTRRRALIRFDLSAIPAGSTINAASLTVSVVFGKGSTATFEVHRVLQAWGEGNKSGNNGLAASTGEATWNNRMHATAAWSGAGAEGDYTGSASASASLATSGSGTFSGATLTADVQSWVDNPAQNNGWVLRLQNEAVSQIARRLGAREGGGAAQLSLTYTAPPSPATLSAPVLQGGGAFQFTVTTTANFTNIVQASSDLITWSSIATNTPASATFGVTDNDAPNHPMRFYRVLETGAVP